MKVSSKRILIFVCLLVTTTINHAASVQPRIVGGQESQPTARPYFTALMNRNELELTVRNSTLRAVLMNGASITTFEGTLVDCQQGFTQCAGVQDNVCLIERGETTFREKALNCQLGGGIAAIIYNNEPGFFIGTLSSELQINPIDIPVVSVSDTSGIELLGELGQQVKFDFSDEPPITSFCGGSYIGNGWVLTAAHCVVDIETPETIAVNIGGHDLRVDQQNVIPVVEIRVHPDARLPSFSTTVNNDFALLRLESEPASITPVLAADEQIVSEIIANGTLGTAIGRGLQNPVLINDEPSPEPIVSTVYEVDMPFVSNQVCNDAYRDSGNTVTSSMVCAGTAQLGKGTCFGDSGGPIVVNRNGQDYVVGLTSWGLGCAQAGLYDVFARVPAYLAEINEVLDLPPPANPKDDGNSNDGGVTAGNSNTGGIGVFGLHFLWLLLLFRLLRRRIRK